MFINPFDDKQIRLKMKATISIAGLVTVNLVVWAWAWSTFAERPALMGTAFLAYMLGLRHAFDPDHIAAIDNVVRKLTEEGKAPISVGFFFSLGHSSIVFLASIFIAATAAAMQLDSVADIGGTIGTIVSAVFLLIIGISNLIVLMGIWSAFKRVRNGRKIVDEDLDVLLAGRGLIARILRPVFRVVSRSWHMYPIGFLFGLGFDTATEIGLLGISAMQAAQGMSFWVILVFPALFTAGMSLMDTLDSVLMTGAYGWALVDPLRKLWYNLIITAASVVVALFIGGVIAVNLIVDKFGFDDGVWRILSGVSDYLTNVGYAAVAIFIGCWVFSIIIYRRKFNETVLAQ